MYIKNTASQNLPFCLVNASTGAAVTGATVTAKRCLDGAAQASMTGTVTETAGGQYNMALSQADTNADTGGFLFTATSAIPVHITIPFFAANIPANATQFAGQTITAAAGVTLPSSVASPTNITAGTITTATNLTTNNDKTGYGLSAAAVQAIWDALTSALTTVGSIGKLLVTNIDALISSRTKPADTQAAVTLVSTLTTYTGNTPQTGDSYARLGAPAGASHSADVAAVKVDTAAIKLKTDNLPAAPAAVGDIVSAASVASAVGSRTPTESYAAAGVAPTYDQFLYMLWACMAQFAITSTTISAKKLNGTEAMTFTLNDATTPTSRTRTT